MTEQIANLSSSILASDIDDSVTSLDVTDAGLFPTDGTFRIRINDEIIRVDAITGTTMSSLTRGSESTVASPHNAGAYVVGVLTEEALTALITEIGGGSGLALETSTNPVVDGSATPGTASKASASDHVHPTDTSRAPASGIAESAVTGLVADLAAKAPLASPTFTGTPSLPTGTTGTTQSQADGSTKLATTAYVDTGLAGKAPSTGIAESAVTNLTTDLAAKAPLASPTFTGTPSLPTGTTGTTQSPADNSTKLATTAYADAIAALKANLASPTFTGSPVLPTGTTGVTQTAADNSTKLATTAYADAIAALKANLASPTFTGSPVLPTGTTGVTQSAADNSTKLATTAYTDTGLALKANLASPTFTGSPVLPSGTTGSTATRGDNDTSLATTAFVQTALQGTGNAFAIGSNCFATLPPGSTWGSSTAITANGMQGIRVTMPATGTINDMYFFVTVQSGNAKLLIYDTGNANGTHSTRTNLYASSAIDISAANGTWKGTSGSLSVSVTAGDTLDFGITADNNTAKFGGSGLIASSGMGTLPSGFLAPSGAGTASPKIFFTSSTTYSSPPSTIAEGSITASANFVPLIIWRIV